jgi:hypothetical protein
MNEKEKRIAIIVYQIAIENERSRVESTSHHHRRASDLSSNMANRWGSEAEYDGTWDKIDAKIKYFIGD